MLMMRFFWFWKHLGFGRPPAPVNGDEENLVLDHCVEVEAMAGDEGFGFGGLVVREASMRCLGKMMIVWLDKIYKK